MSAAREIVLTLVALKVSAVKLAVIPLYARVVTAGKNVMVSLVAFKMPTRKGSVISALTGKVTADVHRVISLKLIESAYRTDKRVALTVEVGGDNPRAILTDK